MTCRGCRASSIDLTLNFGSWPIVHHLMKSPQDLRDSYEFAVGVCDNCGLLQLTNPIAPEILYQDYFTLSSWKNQPHVERLIWLISQLSGAEVSSQILEIGCNDGSFFEKLQKAGYTKLYGIEPTRDACSVARNAGFEVEHGFFGLTRAQEIREQKEDIGLLICRQVLEHVADLPDFLSGMNHVLPTGAPVLLEVPDSATNIYGLDYGFWEEHVNYFTEFTLKNLLSAFGFRVAFTEKVVFSGNTIIVLAFKERSCGDGEFENPPRRNALEIDQAKRMGDLWPEFRRNFRLFVERQLIAEKKLGIYGCGARSSTLVNFLGLGDLATCFIDDQEEKQGFFVPGSRLEIRASNFIEDYHIQYLLLGANAENEDRVIGKSGFSQRGIDWSSMLAPSRYLPDFWVEMATDSYK